MKKENIFLNNTRAHQLTASTRLRFAPPKLAPYSCQLWVLAERYLKH